MFQSLIGNYFSCNTTQPTPTPTSTTRFNPSQGIILVAIFSPFRHISRPSPVSIPHRELFQLQSNQCIHRQKDQFRFNPSQGIILVAIWKNSAQAKLLSMFQSLIGNYFSCNSCNFITQIWIELFQSLIGNYFSCNQALAQLLYHHQARFNPSQGIILVAIELSSGSGVIEDKFQSLIGNYFSCNPGALQSFTGQFLEFQSLIGNYFSCNARMSQINLSRMETFQSLIGNYFSCNCSVQRLCLRLPLVSIPHRELFQLQSYTNR